MSLSSTDGLPMLRESSDVMAMTSAFLMAMASVGVGTATW